MKSFVYGLIVFLTLSSCYTGRSASGSPLVPENKIKAGLSSFQYEFLDRINQLRARGCNCGNTYMPPVAALNWNSQLEMAALGHAQDMSRKKYFDHVSKNGRTLKDRIFETGYTYNGYQSYFIGENIAMGQRSIREVMDGWIGSEKHCKNLMNPDFKEVGIAVVNSYWVQDFGARNPFTKNSPRR